MNTITLCVSMYFQVDKGPTKNGWQAGFGPRPPVENRKIGVHLRGFMIRLPNTNLQDCA